MLDYTPVVSVSKQLKYTDVDRVVCQHILDVVTVEVLACGLDEVEKRTGVHESDVDRDKHIAILLCALKNPSHELLRDLVEIMDVRARLKLDNGKRSLVVSSVLVPDVEYPI